MVVNAAGPWVDKVLARAMPGRNASNLRLVKGSHLIFPRLYEGDHAYIFQNRDGRIVFAIPYEGDFTLVGTTDVAFEGDPTGIAISSARRSYICDAVNEYLAADVSPDQAVWSYAGVRPLYDDQSASNSTVTRDYVFELDRGLKRQGRRRCCRSSGARSPPIASLPNTRWKSWAWAARHGRRMQPCPAAIFRRCDFDGFVAAQAAIRPWLPAPVLRRMARAYGTRLGAVLGDAGAFGDLGQHFGGGLTAAEVIYLVRHEYARSADDVLWRRSKLGLHMSAEERAALSHWFERARIEDQAISAATQSASER